MCSLLTAPTEQRYLALIHLLSCKFFSYYCIILKNILRILGDLRIRDWATHKALLVIRSGLNQACSLISQENWGKLSPNTNVVESAHQQSYAWSGTYLPLYESIEG